MLGENLKKYRTIKGFSQAKLAEIIGISPNFISDIETGKRWLSSDTLVNLAQALGIEVFEFVLPLQAPTSDITAFIETYTKKAAVAASEAVMRSLDTLRKQYIN